MLFDTYYEKLTEVLTRIKDTQRDKMQSVSERVAEVIKNDGIIYVFGCGHSHLIGLDCFYRAGGLVNVSAVLDTDLMLHNGAAKSSKMEKMRGITPSVFERYCITEKDMLFVISTSGKNAAPVEMAEVSRENGVFTVSVISSDYFADKKGAPLLYECSDIFIDNCVPHGDAVMDIEGIDVKMGSVSTAASSYIMQSVLMEGARLAAKTVKPDVYLSGNVEGGAEYNKALIKKYMPRIKHL